MQKKELYVHSKLWIWDKNHVENQNKIKTAKKKKKNPYINT